MKIIKRNGAEVPFDITKIITAVTNSIYDEEKTYFSALLSNTKIKDYPTISK